MSRWKYFNQTKSANGSAIRELVFGLEDGIVSTGGAVIGIAAGTGSDAIVILSGLVIVIVEALSMAAGTFLSSKSTRQLLERRIGDERLEIRQKPEEERQELRDMYRARGFSDREIEILVNRITRNEELWLEEMACKELGIGLGQLTEKNGAAGVMWVAYMFGGALPIVPFMILPVSPAMLCAFVLSLVGLFGIGYWKGIVTKTNAIRSAIEMTVVAASAGVLGYVIGRVIGAVTGIEVMN